MKVLISLIYNLLVKRDILLVAVAHRADKQLTKPEVKKNKQTGSTKTICRRGDDVDADGSAAETRTRLQVSRELARNLATRDSPSCAAVHCGPPPPRACVIPCPSRDPGRDFRSRAQAAVRHRAASRVHARDGLQCVQTDARTSKLR